MVHITNFETLACICRPVGSILLAEMGSPVGLN